MPSQGLKAALQGIFAPNNGVLPSQGLKATLQGILAREGVLARHGLKRTPGGVLPRLDGIPSPNDGIFSTNQGREAARQCGGAFLWEYRVKATCCSAVNRFDVRIPIGVMPVLFCKFVFV